MKKIILLIFIFLYSHCSFDNKTGIWENSNTVDINIQESSNFAIALDKCFINEPSIDNGGAVITE